MDWNDIEKLLDKYDNSETSLKEEAMLKDFFSSSKVPEHLKEHKVIFNYFTLDSKKELTAPIRRQPSNNYFFLKVAAVIVLLVGIFSQTNFNLNFYSSDSSESSLTTSEHAAYNETKKALQLVSLQINNVFYKMEALNNLDYSINKGKQNIEYIKLINPNN